MAGHPEHPPTPLDFDARNPDFHRNCAVWAQQTHRDIAEIIARTRDEIATSQALMAEIDRVIALR